MRFLRQSLVGVFLAALTLGLLAYAGQMIGGAVQDRMSKENKARPAQERVFARERHSRGNGHANTRSDNLWRGEKPTDP